MEKKVHVFEHLGQAPYRYDGYDEILFINPITGSAKAGGACDHCGTAIRHAFYFVSNDGKRFKVGSSCIEKSGDKGLRKFVSEEQRKAKAAKEVAELPKLKEELVRLLGEKQEKAKSLGHPNFHFSQQGKTYYDYVEFFLAEKFPRHSSLKKLVRELRKI